MANQPQYCPAAVVHCCMHSGVGRSKKNDSKASDMRLKARNHLLALNWELWYAKKGGYKKELRYTSPNQKTFYSLRAACRSLIDEQGSQNLTPNLNASPAVNLHAKAEAESMDFGDLGQEENHARRTKRGCRFDEGSQNLTHNLRTNLEKKWVMVSQTLQSSSDDALHSRKRRRKNTEVNLHDKAEAESTDLGNLGQEDDNATHAKPRRRRGKGKRRGIANLMASRDDRKEPAVKHTRVQTSGKQEWQKVLPRFADCNPRAVVLSKLIENNVVFPGAKVYYGGKKGRVPLAKGSITNDGIKCNCCNEVLTLTGFEVHAGSKNHRPAANIFVEDGRSLADCHRQMVSTDNTATAKGSNLMKSNSQKVEHYDMCVVCRDGGELICCDHCPCTYHRSCLGLKDTPCEDWFCPLCCCAICGEGEFKQRTPHSVDDDDGGLVRICDQCEHKFHTGCIRKSKRELKEKSQNKWFCSDRCEHVFSSLHELIGKPFSTSENNLTWRLLKSSESDRRDVSTSTDGKFLKELQRKLHAAVELMHECFEPAKEPLTGRDLIEDVIFNRRSELKQLNYVGFYTVVLEKKRKIISVATVRVYEKVAEIPFVATMFKYRRNGMCRLLMAELEKQLIALGVERLVLPSAPTVLDAWTTKFGFSKMTASERLNYLNYTFLDFQGTTMCQKFLMKTPSASPCLSQAV